MGEWSLLNGELRYLSTNTDCIYFILIGMNFYRRLHQTQLALAYKTIKIAAYSRPNVLIFYLRTLIY
jgi:hypothetical protein